MNDTGNDVAQKLKRDSTVNGEPCSTSSIQTPSPTAAKTENKTFRSVYWSGSKATSCCFHANSEDDVVSVLVDRSSLTPTIVYFALDAGDQLVLFDSAAEDSQLDDERAVTLKPGKTGAYRFDLSGVATGLQSL